MQIEVKCQCHLVKFKIIKLRDKSSDLSFILIFQNILRLVKRFYIFYFYKNLELFWLILKVFSEKYAIINLSDVHGLCVREKKQTERQVIE